mgnify:CR=1 FL=1
MIFLIVLVLAGGYALLAAKPGLYYGRSMEYRNFTLHARGDLPTGVDTALDRAIDRLGASEFFSADKKFDVYLPATPGEFRFFAPFMKNERVRLNPFTGDIFLAAADFKEDKLRREASEHDYRPLGASLAGAAARELARRMVEPLTYLTMSEWRIGGYAELISGGMGMFNPPDICAGRRDDPELLAYEYGLAVDMMMKEENEPYHEVLNKSYAYDDVRRRLTVRYCGH